MPEVVVFFLYQPCIFFTCFASSAKMVCQNKVCKILVFIIKIATLPFHYFLCLKRSEYCLLIIKNLFKAFFPTMNLLKCFSGWCCIAMLYLFYNQIIFFCFSAKKAQKTYKTTGAYCLIFIIVNLCTKRLIIYWSV